MAMSDVEFHIEELVLSGFPSEMRLPIGDSIERELTRLLGEQGLGALQNAIVDLDSLPAGTMRLTQGATPQAMGGEMARTIHDQLIRAGGKTP